MGSTIKGKAQAAPKEFLRRGLLTGTEKLKGQLRDAAEGGRREDTEADRAQGAIQLGTQLAVDKLGRLALKKKKAKSWSGESVPGDAPQDRPDAPAPGQVGLTTPPSSAEPVRIKTREAVHDAPAAGYGRTDLPRTDQPVVKTKEVYARRQADGRTRMGHESVSTRSAAELVGDEFSTQPAIKTRDSYAQHIPERVPSQPLEQGRQRFVRERELQTAAQRAGVKKAESSVFTSVEGVNTSRPASFQPIRSGGSVSNRETVREITVDRVSRVKAGRSEGKISVKASRQKFKTPANPLRQRPKMAEHSANAARQTARATVQAQRRAVKAADGARQAAATVGRPAAKAAMSALRGAVSAIQAAVAPLAAGGGAVIAVVLVLCLVAALIMSPLGIFFGGEETDGQTIADAVREINQEYSAKLEESKTGVTYDQMLLSGARAPWPEVLAVYAVKTTSDPASGQEVVSMDDEKKELLKQVFWDMNELSSFTSTVPGEGDEEDTTTLHITVTAKTADEMADTYGFNADQRQQLVELLSDEYRELWNAILYGVGTGSGEIVAVALSQVGNVGGQPYWSWYGFTYRVNWCAIFVSWCADQCGYIDAGVVPKFSGCVQGSRWFKDRGLWQDKSYTPNPGDVIFFDWNDPGGFSGPQDGVPDHVGIVEKVENGRVYTIEGNSGDKCCQRSYPVGYYEIYGYGMLCA